jgi:hypothetical protein
MYAGHERVVRWLCAGMVSLDGTIMFPWPLSLWKESVAFLLGRNTYFRFTIDNKTDYMVFSFCGA